MRPLSICSVWAPGEDVTKLGIARVTIIRARYARGVRPRKERVTVDAAIRGRAGDGVPGVQQVRRVMRAGHRLLGGLWSWWGVDALYHLRKQVGRIAEVFVQAQIA